MTDQQKDEKREDPDELEARELGEDELDEASGGDPGYFHPTPYTGPIGGH